MKVKSEELIIYEIGTLHKEILKKLKGKNDSLEIDFGDVKKIDLSHIQLFIALKKYCDTVPIDFKITNISSRQISQTFKMFKLNEKFGVDV